MPSLEVRRCIKCGKEIKGELSQHRSGFAALKCEDCLINQTINLAEEAAGRRGTLRYSIDDNGNFHMSGLVGPFSDDGR